MTFEEAKKILEKEMVISFHSTKPFVFDESGWIEHEKPSVLEAFRVLAKEGYYISISGHDYNMREKRLKKEYEENTKAPGSGEEQSKEKKGIIYPSTFPKADFYYKHVLNESNPALKESASQFNDALLDEQAKEIESLRDKCKKYVDVLCSARDKLRELKAENRRIKDSDLNLEGLIYATRELEEKNKKIEELTMENERLKDQVAVLYACKENNEKYNLKQIKRLGKEIARLNKIIHKKNLKIEELGKESSRHLEGKIKMFGENVDLEQILKDKNAVLSDVAEELRLSKIREKNLTEVSQKYMKENEELKKKVADKVVEKIDDVQALKNAESALAWKDRVIYYKDMAIAYNEKEIADLGKELKAKHKKYVWYKGAYEAAQQILNTIADYAAKHPDKKFSDQMVEDCADSVKPEAKREKLSSEKITEIEKKVSDLFKQRDKEIADFMFVKSELFGGSDIFDQMKAQAFCEARYALLNSNFLIK